MSDTATEIKTVGGYMFVPAREPVKDNTHSVIVWSIELRLQKSIFSSRTALSLSLNNSLSLLPTVFPSINLELLPTRSSCFGTA